MSFYALREFMTLAPTRRSDYPALVAAFYFALPMQYLLIALDWYGLFAIFIPVYLFLLLPILASLGGDTTRYLERGQGAMGTDDRRVLHLRHTGAADTGHPAATRGATCC